MTLTASDIAQLEYLIDTQLAAGHTRVSIAAPAARALVALARRDVAPETIAQEAERFRVQKERWRTTTWM